jgi:hypothetical protein
MRLSSDISLGFFLFHLARLALDVGAGIWEISLSFLFWCHFIISEGGGATIRPPVQLYLSTFEVLTYLAV